MPIPADENDRASLIFLAACSALLVLARLHTLYEPLHGDLAVYAVSAREWLLGRGLYSDLFDVKPPGVFWAYAAAQYLFGYNPLSVFALNISCAVLTLIAVFYAGFLAGGRLRTGIWAGVFWTLISGDIQLWANQPNTEAFINLFAAAGFALLLGCRDGEDLPPRKAAALGALFTLAALFKQNSLAIMFALLAAHIIRVRAFSPASRFPLKGPLIACGVVFFSGILLFALARLTGQWEAVSDLLAYQRSYVTSTGGVLASLLRSFGPDIIPDGGLLPVAHLALLFLAGAAGLAAALYKNPRGKPLLLLGWLLGVQAAVALPGWFYTQYYQLWLPFLAVAGAWALETPALSLSSRIPRLAAASGLLLAAVLLGAQLPYFTLSAEDWSRRKFGDEFAFTDRVGRDLKELLRPGESFYAWGTQPGLYFASGLRPPAGLFYNAHLLSGPRRAQLSRRLLAALAQEPPEMFIALHWEYEERRRGGPAHPVLAWALDNYRELVWEGHRGAFVYFAKKGGLLEKRIKAGGLPIRFLKKNS